jgi:hypothetical protein
MLKKAGIVVAAATASLLAVSPLAFATGHDHPQPRPVNVNNTNVEEGNLQNDCRFGQSGPEIEQNAAQGSGLLGILNPVIAAAAPVTAQLQALNCNNINVSDLIDSDSNNTTRTETNTEFDHSFDTFSRR